MTSRNLAFDSRCMNRCKEFCTSESLLQFYGEWVYWLRQQVSKPNNVWSDATEFVSQHNEHKANNVWSDLNHWRVPELCESVDPWSELWSTPIGMKDRALEFLCCQCAFLAQTLHLTLFPVVVQCWILMHMCCMVQDVRRQELISVFISGNIERRRPDVEIRVRTPRNRTSWPRSLLEAISILRLTKFYCLKK